jgi:hypothetical protein
MSERMDLLCTVTKVVTGVATVAVTAGSLYALTKLPSENVHVPMQFGFDGSSTWSVPSKYGMLLYPVCSAIVGLPACSFICQRICDRDESDVPAEDRVAHALSLIATSALLTYAAQRAYAIAKNGNAAGLNPTVLGSFLGFEAVLCSLPPLVRYLSAHSNDGYEAI